MTEIERLVKYHDWILVSEIIKFDYRNDYYTELKNYEDDNDTILCKGAAVERCVKHFARYLPIVYRQHANENLHQIRSNIFARCCKVEICGETFYIIEGLTS